MPFQTKIAWDVKLFLILIPLINIINYYLTYSNISISGHTLLTFCLDTLEGYAAWLVNRCLILFLDKKIPFDNNLLKRILIQTFLTLFTGVAVIVGLTIIINAIATNTPVPTSFFQYDIFIISTWFFVMNGIYISAYFYKEWQYHKFEKSILSDDREKLHAMFKDGFMVKNGKTDLILPYNEIAGFYMAGEYVTCTTLSDKKYVLDQSMEKIENELPYELFFRLNRQFLLHRQVITGFQRADNGKLNVLITLLKNINPPIPVSRTKAAAFKNWFHFKLEDTSTPK